ncbi:MAG: NADH-quinone oxidoreductase subunit L [Pseudoxanthomonas sp.]
MPSLLSLLALVAPALLLATALLSLAFPGQRPLPVLRTSRAATATTLLLALAAAVLTAVQGPMSSPVIGMGTVGLSVRLDVVSCTMFLLVSFVGLVVVQYSRNYLDGDARQGAFIGGLCLTLAAVLLLVLAGNLYQLAAAWVATSLALHRLLVFYRERPAALLAARKKFVTARIGDACLIGSCVVLATAFGSTDIATVLERANTLREGIAPHGVRTGTLLIAAAALLKSAQFPTHGWLPEVMETPTPVSALLHAGIINAGGFLVIRFADVMLLSVPSLHMIAVVGGFTALFGSVVMLTQTSIKASLAWSTVAQMGFMLLQCGLGAFAIALLHIVAHSLYKAHAFLSSGSVIDNSRAVRPSGLPSPPRTGRVLASLATAVLLYAAAGWLFGVSSQEPAAMLALGAILIMGLGVLIAQSAQGEADRHLVIRIVAAAGGATIAYFGLQAGATWLSSSTLPAMREPDPAGLAIMGLAVASFAIVAVLQVLAPVRVTDSRWCAARVHLANGLYVNALFNRLVGALPRPATARP